MTEFLDLLPPPKALNRLLDHLHLESRPEEIETYQALGRVTLDPAVALHPLPAFPRSTVDGYAVRARDTHGASASLPAYLHLVGEVLMGKSPTFSLQAAQCGLIHTGGMLPEGADAAVMIENTQKAREDEIEVLRAVGVGENVIKVGEDVGAGDEVIPPGTRLRPAEIGGLMALGITSLRVAVKPKVGILSSGDEVVSPENIPGPGEVRDVNTYTLRALVEQAGGEPVSYGIIPDNLHSFRQAARRALAECDLVVFTAGSSVSVRDLTAQTIDELGKPGVLVHGVNVRPGKPTILAVCEHEGVGKAVIGLPGNPVSALVIAGLFVVPVIEKWLGMSRRSVRPMITARAAINLSSVAGREDWVPVRLTHTSEGVIAEPIFGKSNLIFTLIRSDGLLRIPPDANGIEAGELVDVVLM